MKVFRNLARYIATFGASFPDLDATNRLCSAYEFQPLQGYDRISMGLIEHERGWFVREVGEGYLFTIKTAHRKPPESFVREVLQTRQQELEDQGRPAISKEEVQELKEQIQRELTPRALPVIRHHQVYLSPNGHFWMDTLNDASGEFIIKMFEQMIPEMRINPVIYGGALEARQKKVMTGAMGWPEGLSSIGDGATANEAGRTHIRPMSSILAEAPSQIFEVRYLGVRAHGFTFRWHPDGSFSQIEGATVLRDQIVSLDRITSAIDRWFE